ncbi:MAG: hypothetical protein ATN36_08780 [Epulopiscium sp. Nele67-Bin005]|nr:MAG: hypothetical protein ATN36_08780 [Epulopiscium sp. Nele67-Bin005]
MSYQLYKWTFRPKSGVITPFLSDILWGHLVWAISYEQGNIKELLSQFNTNTPPWVISDAFIKDCLPIPRYGKPFEFPTNIPKQEGILIWRIIEHLDKVKYVHVNIFNEMCSGLTPYKLYQEILEGIRNPITFFKLAKPLSYDTNIKRYEKILSHCAKTIYDNKTEVDTKKRSILSAFFVEQEVNKNSINRLTNSAEQLYTQVETYYTDDLDVYLKINSEFDITILEKAIKYIEASGYGKKASAGKGQIQTISFEKSESISMDYKENGFISLSTYIPNEKDYTEIIYANSNTKYGKISSNLGENNVFKHPFTYDEAGSIFRGSPDVYKGKMLYNVHKNPDIVQYGLSFSVGVNI